MKKVRLGAAVTFLAAGVLLSPTTVEACYVCGIGFGQSVCNGNFNGFDNCAQQVGWCATYGEFCSWFEQEDMSPDGALNTGPSPEVTGATAPISETVAFSSGRTLVRQVCNGAVLHRTYSAELQVEREAETQKITI